MARSPRFPPVTIPPMGNLEDARTLFKQKLSDFQTTLIQSLPTTEFEGSRLQDVGDPQAPQDAVNLRYLQANFPAGREASKGVKTFFTGNQTAGQSTSASPTLGVAVPDLDFPINILVLTADTILGTPVHFATAPGFFTSWVLLIQQDSTGGHSLQMDTSGGYYVNVVTSSPQSPGSSQCVLTLLTNEHGNTIISASAIDVPIAP